MKELERTKRISISTVVFILILVIGVLTFKMPTNVYRKTKAETFAMLKTQEYLVAHADIDQTNSVLIDIRDKFDYSINHLENALNIPTSEILNANSISLFNELRDQGKTAILYGKNPDEANSAYMLLYQLGYDNIKILNGTTHLVNTEFQVKNHDLEKPIPNYMDIFKQVESDEAAPVEKVAPPPPKKVIAVKKKKKRKPEGGC
ncbi:MAG: rhodanese-like domain-containing protein [Maribacter sp.]|uniref:rhodanese-like domain-containing protein n=1 Tax=Maribacter sp. TaxID=1897614 RepID=UPI003C7816B5